MAPLKQPIAAGGKHSPGRNKDCRAAKIMRRGLSWTTNHGSHLPAFAVSSFGKGIAPGLSA